MFARTKRLTLRPGWPEDDTALTAAIEHEAVATDLAHTPWSYARADAGASLSQPRAGHEPRFQIVAHELGFRLIGGIALVPHGNADTCELGYWLAPEAWGRGYATEAGRVVIEMARHALGIRRLVAQPFADNPASARVLCKLGFVETGRSRLHAPARSGEVETIDFALDLAEARPCAHAASMPIAA